MKRDLRGIRFPSGLNPPPLCLAVFPPIASCVTVCEMVSFVTVSYRVRPESLFVSSTFSTNEKKTFLHQKSLTLSSADVSL